MSVLELYDMQIRVINSSETGTGEGISALSNNYFNFLRSTALKDLQTIKEKCTIINFMLHFYMSILALIFFVNFPFILSKGYL